VTGRPPKLDGRKAQEGGRTIVLEPASREDMIRPPKTLDRVGKQAWAQAVRSLAPARIVSHGDLMALEIMCKHWARWRKLEAKVDEMNAKVDLGGELTKTPNGHLQLSTLRIAADRAAKQYMAIAREFGLTPVARVRTAGTAQGDFFVLMDAKPTKPAKDQAAPPPRDETDPYSVMH